MLPKPTEVDVPLSEPFLRGNESRYVLECINSNWVSSAGEFVERFERNCATQLQVAHTVATSSGTAALHIAMKVAGVETDDEVLVSSLTFIAPANAIRYVGAWPVFIDSEPDYWQMNVAKARAFLELQCCHSSTGIHNKSTGRRVRAILPVHILGHSVDMRPILDLAQEFDLLVIEDAAESLGAQYHGESVGRLGHIACLSFNGNKIVTTGGGGLIATNNADWAQRARHLTTQAKCTGDEYIHDEIGYNYRMTNLQAALGCAQLEQLESFVDAKRAIAASYKRELADITGVTMMPEAPWARSTFWLSTALFDSQKTGKSASEIVALLKKNRIQSRRLWQPLHLSPAHRSGMSCSCPVADSIYSQAVSLPSSVRLLDSNIATRIRTILELG